jgi:hypothetical protein
VEPATDNNSVALGISASNPDNYDAFFGDPPKKACYIKRVYSTYDKTFSINLGAIFFNNGVTQTFFYVVL